MRKIQLILKHINSPNDAYHIFKDQDALATKKSPVHVAAKSWMLKA